MLADGVTVPKSSLIITERIEGTLQSIDFVSAKYVNSQLVVTFDTDKVYNPGGSELEESVTNGFNVATSCTSSSGIDSMYDYSQLGETWSAPRIFRIPDPAQRGNGNEDSYVAVMGAGMGNTNLCAGSAVFIVNLDDTDENPAGSIYGAAINGGPITIVDTEENNETDTKEAYLLEQSILNLDVEFRTIIILREIQELSYESISKILKLPLGTVKSRINRGKLKLRDLLNKRGVER